MITPAGMAATQVEVASVPTYVYQCRNCSQSVEVLQRFSDEPLKICPHCGGRLQRLLFPPAIIFRGSGWYCTDYRSPSGAASESGKAEESAVGKGDNGDGDRREKERTTKAAHGAGDSEGD